MAENKIPELIPDDMKKVLKETFLSELKDDVVRPELIREIVEAYGLVRDNLARHDPTFPPKLHLLDRVKSGNPHRGVKSVGAEGAVNSSSQKWSSFVGAGPRYRARAPDGLVNSTDGD